MWPPFHQKNVGSEPVRFRTLVLFANRSRTGCISTRLNQGSFGGAIVPKHNVEKEEDPSYTRTPRALHNTNGSKHYPRGCVITTIDYWLAYKLLQLSAASLGYKAAPLL